eukprot:TRINITY_DN4937_c0_g2_i1.p1 TRINITY_DN4937_c0_g2~~TRINITY_DN4937_c0_g2_i1.p1  ORF type:complete len:200 (+),score=46.88 TRINITY_DN4937_c0_g2_i1:258-857(+)
MNKSILLRCEQVILIVWTVQDTPDSEWYPTSLSTEKWCVVLLQMLEFMLVFSQEGLIIMVGIWFAYKLQKMKTKIKKPKQIDICAFCMSILLPIIFLSNNNNTDSSNQPLDNRNQIYVLSSVGICIISSSSLLAMFIPKFYVILSGRDHEGFLPLLSLSSSLSLFLLFSFLLSSLPPFCAFDITFFFRVEIFDQRNWQW